MREAGSASRWDAPRIAYELAAEWAEKNRELAAGRGGADGRPFTEVAGLGKAWRDLRTLEQYDVLAALGSQARSAVWEARRQRGMAEDAPVIIDIGYYTAKLCEQASDALRALNDPGGREPWAMPGCAHCAALLATALIDLQVNAILATGITDPAAVLRRLLGGMAPAGGNGDAPGN
jgi:hypothetical protein